MVYESKYVPSTYQVPDVTWEVPYVVQESSVQESSVQESTPPKKGVKKLLKPDYSEAFKEFWLACWPRKNGSKLSAWESWKNIDEDEHADVIRGVLIVGAEMSKIEEAKRPHHSTWLNQRRWEAAISFENADTSGNAGQLDSGF